MVWLPSYVNKEIWLAKSFLLRHTIACNVVGGRHSAIVAWNVAEVELASTPATLHVAIAKVDTRNSAIARNVASCVRSNRIIVPVVWLTRAHHTHALIWIVEQKYWRAAFLIKGSSCLSGSWSQCTTFIYNTLISSRLNFRIFSYFSGPENLDCRATIKTKIAWFV